MPMKILFVFIGLFAIGCDDGGGGGDASLPIDAAPPTAAPPPPLTGLFHVRFERTGGDCPPHLPGAETWVAEEQAGTLTLTRRGLRLTGTRAGDRVEAAGAGTTQVADCDVQSDATWTATVRRPGNAFTVQGTTTYRPEGTCAFAACTAEWTARAARVGGEGPGAYTRLALDPGDTAVTAAVEFRDAAWFATTHTAGGRIWRLVNDVGIPSLTAVVTDGFRSENNALGGNNRSISALLPTDEALFAATHDAAEGTPPGDGFDLWAYDGTTWMALTTDGLGDATREAVDSLAALDGALYLGVRHPAGAQVWRRNIDGMFVQVFPVPDATDAAHADGPRDPRHCATRVTSLLVHAGRLHAALGGPDCAAGAFILRLDDPQRPEWTLVSEGGLAHPSWHTATLATDGTELFALTHGTTAALFRHAGGRHWVLHATDGFGHPGARTGPPTIAAPARDFLFFPVDGEGGGSLYASQGGSDPRDLLRISGEGPLHDGTGLGPALAFEQRLFIGTVGTPAVILRASTLLAEQGPGTVVTAHDRVETAARGAGTACHRSAAFFNPALQADQPLRVVLPPGVEPDDDVLLPALYLLPPDLKTPPPASPDDPDPRPARLAAWFDAAEATHAPLLACLFGRPATIPCAAGEGDVDCLHRCLAERVPTLVEDAGLFSAGPPIGPEAASAIIAALGEPPTLPVIERMALVLVDLGSGFAVDAPDEAPWTPGLPARDEEGQLWPGELGAWASALRASVGEVERCWPRSIRSSPTSRYLLGHGRGAFSALQALLARDDAFNGAIAFDGTYSIDRLLESPAGRALVASITEPFRGVAAGSLAPLFLAAHDACAACETRALCDALAMAGRIGHAYPAAAHPLQTLAPALKGLSDHHRNRLPPTITCDAIPPGDCGACGGER